PWSSSGSSAWGWVGTDRSSTGISAGSDDWPKAMPLAPNSAAATRSDSLLRVRVRLLMTVLLWGSGRRGRRPVAAPVASSLRAIAGSPWRRRSRCGRGGGMPRPRTAGVADCRPSQALVVAEDQLFHGLQVVVELVAGDDAVVVVVPLGEIAVQDQVLVDL